ncbi:MAG TPA: hydroxymethylglutaryl-CoA lyase [Actinomycetota bacterium]|nr:hydroxymethylglutaryl-CoA lyase [Actinomycetota bacterium]
MSTSQTGELPGSVRIVEVGPRDGLQNEDALVPAGAKVTFIESLAAAGLQVVEATSFVSPRAVPQLADADEVFPRIRRLEGVRYPVLVPNMRGMERAERAGADAVAVFTAASEAFTERNIGMTIAGSLETFEPVLDRAHELGWWRRGYVSTAFGCPYSGAVEPSTVVEVCADLLDLGCEEISVGDTIGVAEPDDVRRVCDALLERLPVHRLALHLHDTRGRALDNVEAGLERGVAIYDSSAGGTGGCPFAPGAPGNLATESLCGLLDRLGIAHGVDANEVASAAAALRAGMVDRAHG